MLVYDSPQGPVDCRLIAVPACERDGDQSQSAPINALACFQLRMRDTLDFTVDFTQWLAGNGNPILTSATFAASSESPSAPTIAGQAFSPTGKCVVVLSASQGAVAGDAYYLDISVTTGPTVAVAPDVVIPSRTLVRRIHVVVING